MNKGRMNVAEHADAQLDPAERRRLGPLADALFARGLAVGLVGLLVTALLAAVGGAMAPQRVLYAYLVAFVFWLSLCLGGLFFVLIHRLCRTGTVTTYRRIGELFAGATPHLAVFVLPIVIGAGGMYGWATYGPGEFAPGKEAWLSHGFFAARVIVVLAVLSFLGWYFFQVSRKQDATGDPQLTLRLQGRAAPAIIAYAFALSLLAFDLLMSLDSHWFSTIFAVYYFAGAFMAFHCALALSVYRLQERGYLTRSVNVEHYHDIGKMMFAFVVFWAYIAFSQFMLIWYGNIPEETVWFIRHGYDMDPRPGYQGNPFSLLLAILLFGHFVIPFFGLISRTVKRKPARLSKWAIWLLVMHWLDMIWLIRPELRGADHVTVITMNWVDWLALVAALVGLGGVLIAALGRLARTTNLVAERDPRIGEALVFENF